MGDVLLLFTRNVVILFYFSFEKKSKCITSILKIISAEFYLQIMMKINKGIASDFLYILLFFSYHQKIGVTIILFLEKNLTTLFSIETICSEIFQSYFGNGSVTYIETLLIAFILKNDKFSSNTYSNV